MLETTSSRFSVGAVWSHFRVWQPHLHDPVHVQNEKSFDSLMYSSFILRQIAAQARSQSRPPLALFGLVSEDSQGKAASVQVDPPRWNPDTPAKKFVHLKPPASSLPATSNLRRRHTDSEIFQWSGRRPLELVPLPARQFSTNASCLAEEEEDNEQDDISKLEGKVHLPSAFQNLLQTRRTTSRFTSLASPTPVLDEQDYWRNALRRAVLCGYQAPNHKRTEPFTFRQMIAPSARTQRLADIAYHVAMRQANLDTSLSNEQLAAKQDRARQKRDRWNQIPAFLVATVDEENSFLQEENGLELLNEYDQFRYVPPQSERALENYASTCAAVQNVLLSLHSEDISSKWATGPIISTPAFRTLIQAGDNERVVALIMIGQAAGPIPKSPRRLRRPLQSLLIDL